MAIFISRVFSLHAKLSPLIYEKWFGSGQLRYGGPRSLKSNEAG